MQMTISGTEDEIAASIAKIGGILAVYEVSRLYPDGDGKFHVHIWAGLG